MWDYLSLETRVEYLCLLMFIPGHKGMDNRKHSREWAAGLM